MTQGMNSYLTEAAAQSRWIESRLEEMLIAGIPLDEIRIEHYSNGRVVLIVNEEPRCAWHLVWSLEQKGDGK